MPSNSERPRRVRGVSEEIQQAAIRLRHESTLAEAVLWDALRAGRLDGLKFRRQHPLGWFVLDFCCPARHLVVEVDGAAHDDVTRAEHDAARTEQLRLYGYIVLRVRNEQVLHDLASVLEQIRRLAQ